ncbi:MAG: molybdopterin molybdotransferase MoeA [Cystobacterineae bacterium]|nr:molybdopterin molybdotransferase MoeA [Cystobacterineae bacterium]
MLSFDEAQRILKSEIQPLPSQTLPFAQAFGRVLAKALHSPTALPRFDNSAMDGFALCTQTLPPRARVAFEVAAGEVSTQVLQPHQVARIFTGARLPQGANCVVAQEHVRYEGEELVLPEGLRPGQHIRKAGEDIEEGQLLLSAGTRLGPGALAVLAASGIAHIEAFQQPRLALLSTGNELFPPLGAPAPPGYTQGTLGVEGGATGLPHEAGLFDSNSPMLASWAQSLGVHLYCEHLPDDKALVRRRLEALLPEVDVVVTVGGISVGRYDGVRQALTEMGCRFLIPKIAMKPGKPLCLGRLAQRYVLGLPGNPGAAFVGFFFFLAPLLRGLQGERQAFPQPIGARLCHAAKASVERLEIHCAHLEWLEGEAQVRLSPHFSSGAVLPLAWCNALVPLNKPHHEAGERIEAFRLE